MWKHICELYFKREEKHRTYVNVEPVLAQLSKAFLIGIPLEIRVGVSAFHMDVTCKRKKAHSRITFPNVKCNNKTLEVILKSDMECEHTL